MKPSELALASARRIDPKATEFVIRLYDGFDHEWMDVTGPLSADDAIREWEARTDEGRKHTSYGDIDYYAIYPTTVKMVFGSDDHENGDPTA